MQYMDIFVVKGAFNDWHSNLPHLFHSVYMIVLSTLSKVIEVFVQLVSLEVNHTNHPLPF